MKGSDGVRGTATEREGQRWSARECAEREEEACAWCVVCGVKSKAVVLPVLVLYLYLTLGMAYSY